jgi:PleD family two-component response regulator
MILALVDDLIFMSKIKSTAAKLGVPVVISRSADGALAEMRKQTPALVIFDLNNARTNPLGTFATMKADPALAAIPTLGFAGHTQGPLMDAAKQAGIGEVLTRGAFNELLPEILARSAGADR